MEKFVRSPSPSLTLNPDTFYIQHPVRPITLKAVFSSETFIIAGCLSKESLLNYSDTMVLEDEVEVCFSTRS